MTEPFSGIIRRDGNTKNYQVDLEVLQYDMLYDGTFTEKTERHCKERW